MNLEQLTELFRWMSIINVVLLMVSVILIILLKDFVYKIHAKLFGVNESNLSVVIYSYLGIYKLLIIVFNIVPYFTLLIINQ